MLKRIILTLITILLAVVLVSADGGDDQGNPNDPDVNDRANACFEGGDMESKCDTEWEWMCGWHIIRLDDPQDEVSRAEFPVACVSLLPALIVEPEQAPAPVIIIFHTAGCIHYQTIPTIPTSSFSIDFGGGNYTPFATQTYESTDCTPPLGIVSGVGAVYAPFGRAAAQILCISHGHTGAGEELLNGVFKCIGFVAP